MVANLGMADWIDNLAQLWGFQWNGTQIKTYKVWGRDEYPGTVEVPSAITFVENDAGFYSTSEGDVSIVTGLTEFHLFPTPDRTKVPAILPLFKQIKVTAAKNIGLGHGRDLSFLLTNDSQGRIRGPLVLQWGEEMHLGLTVHWTVATTLVIQVSIEP